MAAIKMRRQLTYLVAPNRNVPSCPSSVSRDTEQIVGERRRESRINP